MCEIDELSDKYLVIKQEDLEKYFSQFTKGMFTTYEEKEFIDNIPFNTVLKEIASDRKAFGKKDNKYVILNLNDEIDLHFLKEQLQSAIYFPSQMQCLVKYPSNVRTTFIVNDIATDLVNAILKAEDK